MRKSLLLLYCAFVSVSMAAQPKADDLKGELGNGKFTLNNVEISKVWKVSPLIHELGDAERIRDGHNKTHTYDKYGIVLYEKQKDNVGLDSLSEVQFYFSEVESNSVTPEGYYTGSFKIENLKISKDLSAAELRKKLKGYAESESYMPNSYRFANKGLYIFFQFDETDSRLQKISIGPDRR